MSRAHTLARLNTSFILRNRRRGATLRRLYKSIGLVYFGSIHQHHDDLNIVRGFTSSLTHTDTHFAVGTYNGHNLRIVDRWDIFKTHQAKRHLQRWLIIEISLSHPDLRHIVLLPTGHDSSAYERLFVTQPHMQPLNTLLKDKHSREFHGRFQILSRTTHLQAVERIFDSPTIAAIASRFWPIGIEIEHGKLLLYITEPELKKERLESSLSSALWLADKINNAS